jgi:hypothetical protein
LSQELDCSDLVLMFVCSGSGDVSTDEETPLITVVVGISLTVSVV